MVILPPTQLNKPKQVSKRNINATMLLRLMTMGQLTG